MIRLLGYLVAILSLAGAVLALGGWRRSLLAMDIVSARRFAPVPDDRELLAEQSVTLTSSSGAIRLAALWGVRTNHYEAHNALRYGPPGLSHDAKPATVAPVPDPNAEHQRLLWATIEIGQDPPNWPGRLKVRWIGVVMPHWFAGALLLVWPMAWTVRAVRRHRRWSRARAGQCGACGYDLRESPDRCPECGRSRAEATTASRARLMFSRVQLASIAVVPVTILAAGFSKGGFLRMSTPPAAAVSLTGEVVADGHVRIRWKHDHREADWVAVESVAIRRGLFGTITYQGDRPMPYVRLGRRAPPTQAWVQRARLPADATNYSMRLAAGEEYWVRVRVGNAFGASPPSRVLRVHRPIDPDGGIEIGPAPDDPIPATTVPAG